MTQVSNIKQILNNTKFRRVISSRGKKSTNVNQGSLNASFLKECDQDTGVSSDCELPITFGFWYSRMQTEMKIP